MASNLLLVHKLVVVVCVVSAINVIVVRFNRYEMYSTREDAKNKQTTNNSNC